MKGRAVNIWLGDGSLHPPLEGEGRHAARASGMRDGVG
ncbi:hypothetical protein SAMN05444123_10110 [Rhodopseudomonas pseudopalustris]|uniref:Uncharacterized protein n=1 Tax=Rhodopseudomonas pseudopalustris TaxID=1513892 RepID=A0A1H8LBZ1_9BRAD|nr:hypothetical protein SAMN05444123_10110 [Rhodopseudomonas pseudopalustris]